MIAEHKWRQVPGPPEPTAFLTPALAILATALIAGTGPAIRVAMTLPAPRVAIVGVGAALAAIALGSRPAEKWWVRALFAGALAGVLVTPVGTTSALWLAESMLLADWVLRGRPPLPVLPTAPVQSVWPLVAVLIASTLSATEITATFEPLVITAIAVPAVLAGSRWSQPLARIVAAVQRWTTAIVLRVTFIIIGVVAVFGASCVHRLTGYDPTTRDGLRRERGSNGALRERRIQRPERLHPNRMPPLATWRRRIVVSSGFLLLLSIPLVFRYSPLPGSMPPVDRGVEDLPAAVAEADWYPQHRADEAFVLGNLDVWSPLLQQRVGAVRTHTINVDVSGVRRGFEPDGCPACRPVQVWIYGGSAAFGLGQRDEHTIASELARVARQDGLVLNVQNRGVPGDLLWNEANRLSWDAARTGPPDLVVFYDGANEFISSDRLNADHQGDRTTPVNPVIEGYMDDPGLGFEDVPPPEGASIPDAPVVSTDSPEQLAQLTATRYERSRQMSRTIVRGLGVQAVWFWQPTRLTRPPTEGEPTGSDDAGRRILIESTRGLLAPAVVDLGDSLDRVPGPVFMDDVHHNERASSVVAKAMYRNLEPRLRNLASD